MKIGIRKIEIYIPSGRLSSAELAQRLSIDKSFLEDKMGIVSRCIAGKEESASDMGVEALKKIFADNQIEQEDIDLLVVVTQNPDYKLPHTAALIQNRLNLKHIPSFDINLGCSGFVYALAVVKSMMLTFGYQNAIIITADAYSKVIDPYDKNTVTVFGDAACAVLLSLEANNQICEFTLGTDGSGFESLIVPYGGSRRNFDSENPENRNHYLYMNGKKIYNFMMSVMPRDITICCEKNKLKLEDIDYFIFHQANKFMVESLAEKLKLPQEKVVLHMKDYGNTVSSTIPIALKYLQDQSYLKDKTVLVSGFGVGLSWASSIIKY